MTKDNPTPHHLRSESFVHRPNAFAQISFHQFSHYDGPFKNVDDHVRSFKLACKSKCRVHGTRVSKQARSIGDNCKLRVDICQKAG